MAHIVVLGAGLGGIPAALEMKELAGSNHQVTVISKMNKYTFIPSNPWVAVGWRTPEQVEVPLAQMFENHGIHFMPSAAEKVLPETNQILLINGNTIQYDYLILAVGPDLAFDEIPGLGPIHGYTQSVCQTDHAVMAFEKWQNFVENPGPIVVGATQGASCFGPAYEFCMIMDTDLRRRKIRNKVPITFVTSEPYIGHLGLEGVGDTKGLLESVFRDHDIKWICNSKIDEISPDRMKVSEMGEDGQVRKNYELPHSFAMLIPPFRGIPALTGIEGLVNPRGFVLVDVHQKNPKYPNIFGIGVCVAIPPVSKTPVPVGVPKTGFMIESMGSAAAHNILAMINGEPPTYEPTLNAICLADFGDSGVGFVAIPQIPPRNVNWSSRGKHIHLGKIAFEKYFLHKVRSGVSEPFYERHILKMLGIEKLKPLPKE
ncbi:MAG: NAD(P)/FAD-dependent oxidoreductase [Proteobacteria bacterium]|nr:NAD(P)/FAD-dependent oxidoreductase [Pseudomonadota bacterium]MBU4471874.1 NAD(P)/FAD-dependent oxidoreductase [Pseudomonadota bacterium]MCG2751156.1 NAD(P)/FAD-dependent oxidoreductase [Desulfobacteraceae bacterium]